MNKIKISFCLFLFFLSCIYVSDYLKNINLFRLLMSDNKTSTILNTTINSNLSKENTNFIKSEAKVSKQESSKYSEQVPTVYFYNTHQTEEYKSNAYNITPTVVTVSEILKEELLEDDIYSIVENNSIKKGLDKYGYDYSYSYRISMEYLKNKKEKYPSLKYYFDMHRDSVKGEAARIKIDDKNYAKVMFLIGKNHKNYKSNVKNIKIMENYLKKHYPGILRNTYYQPLYSYNQEYDSNMFLVELGGPDNTLEEIYNTSVALGDAISYYVKGEENEK